jgi:hypothetical protein
VLRVSAEILLAPILVGGSTLAARRWGHAVGGVVSGFPAVVGPLLLITAALHRAAFTARAANGTLLGLAALAAFALVYSWVARRAGWKLSVVAAWLAAALTTLLVAWLAGGFGFPSGLLVGALSLAAASRAMPSTGGWVQQTPAEPGWLEVPLRMALTTALVGALIAASELFGSLIGGMLAALPVIASILAAFTHQRYGSGPVIVLLRGMLAGMTGFVGFCAVVAALIEPLGLMPTFALATVTAVVLQLTVLGVNRLGSGPGRHDEHGDEARSPVAVDLQP